MTPAVPERVLERAVSRAVEADGCMVSTYPIGSHGYAQLGWTEDGKSHVVLAHRAAWVHENGPIPDGLTVDHRCFNRRCVRPAHLRLLTRAENARRNAGRDFPLGQCAHGHDLRFMIRQACGRTKCILCRTRLPKLVTIGGRRVQLELMSSDEFGAVVTRFAARRSYRRAQQMADLCFALHDVRIPVQLAVA